MQQQYWWWNNASEIATEDSKILPMSKGFTSHSTHTTTTTVKRPTRDNPGRPVPEETLPSALA